MPPVITTFNEVDWVPCPLQNENVFDVRAVLDRVISEVLDRNSLAAATALVRSNDDARLAVIDTVLQRLGGETAEYD